MAQVAGAEAPEGSFFETYAREITIALIIGASIVLVFGFFMVWQQIVSIHRHLSKNEHYKESLEHDKFPRWFYFDWDKINQSLTDAVPVQQEDDIMLDHDYDGIKELNNHLPPWWKFLFYFTIVLGVAYFIHYEWLGTGMNQYEEYQAEVEQAEIEIAARMELMANSVDETNVELLADNTNLMAGKEVFNLNCIACHGEVAQGTNVGPNLTDMYWIHGGDIKDVFKSVKYGFEGKMVPWGEQLRPSEIQQVASYVLSLQGSEPANAKAPEGEYYDPNAAVEAEEPEVEDVPADTTEATEEEVVAVAE